MTLIKVVGFLGADGSGQGNRRSNGRGKAPGTVEGRHGVWGLTMIGIRLKLFRATHQNVIENLKQYSDGEGVAEGQAPVGAESRHQDQEQVGGEEGEQ